MKTSLITTASIPQYLHISRCDTFLQCLGYLEIRGAEEIVFNLGWREEGHY